LFIAIWPSAPVRALLAGLERPAREGVRWTPEDQWHVTLRFLGNVGQEERRRLSAILHTLDLGALLPARAALGPKTIRLGREILGVPVNGLDRLASAVVAATVDAGQPPDARRFRGHVTLARSRGVDLRPLARAVPPAVWSVDEITLVVSRTASDGAHYEVVERFGSES
jgi:2'-5' RNA ligase